MNGKKKCRMRPVLSVMLLALVLCAAVSAGAATYYVSTTGNDANDGSASDDAHAWATITNGDALNTGVLQPGDTVIVEAGNYVINMPLVMTTSGSDTGGNITYQANGAVKINYVGDTAYWDCIFQIYGANYVTIDGFELGDCTNSIEFYNQASHVTISNCYFHPDSTTPGTNYAIDMRDGGNNFCTIRNNVFRTNYYVKYLEAFVKTTDGNGSAQYGPDTTDLTICNNVFDGYVSYSLLLQWCTSNCKIQNNMFFNSYIAIAGWEGNWPPVVDRLPHADHNCFFNNAVNYSAVNQDGGDITGTDPLLVGGTPPQWPAVPMAPFDYHLTPCSLCVDAGVVAYTGQAYNSTAPDIAAFESSYVAGSESSATTTVTVTGGVGGSPIPGASVTCNGMTKTTNAQGQAVFCEEPGSQTFDASFSGIEGSVTQTLVAGANSVVIPLPVPKVTVVVTNAAGTFIPGATVTVDSGDPITTDGSGEAVAYLVPGTHTITANYHSDNSTPPTDASNTVSVDVQAQMTVPITLTYDVHTFYVSTTGNDANDGSAADDAHAWYSIGHGDQNYKLIVGDTVMVEPGLYEGSTDVLYPGDGPRSAYGVGWVYYCPGVTYKADNAAGPVILKSGCDASNFSYARCFLIGNPWTADGIASNTTLDGFEMIDGNYVVHVIAPNCTIKNCYIHDSFAAQYTLGVYIQSEPGTTIENCVFTDMEGSDPVWPGSAAITSGGGCNGLQIRNNTCNNCEMLLWLTGWNGVDSGVVLENNIFANMYSPGLFIGGDPSQCTEDHNLTFNAPALGGTGDLYADPLFAAGGTPSVYPTDFYLTAGSPAIDTGVNVGLPYQGMAPDMGAFESSYTGGAQYSTIGALKALAVGTPIQLTSPVTATASSTTFTDESYYLEDSSRAAGIKVQADDGVTGLPSVSLGDQVTANGILRQDANGQVYIGLHSVNASSGTALAPLGMINKTVVGWQIPGLLVRTFGLVTAVTADYIYVDDGSGLQDGSGNIGVRVMLSGLSAPITETFEAGTTYVRGVTGEASLDAGGVPCIRPRGDSDITL